MIIKNIRSDKLLHLKDFLDLGILGDGAYLSGGAAMSIVDNNHNFDDYDVFFQFVGHDDGSVVEICNVHQSPMYRIPLQLLTVAESLKDKGFELIYVCPRHTLYSYKKDDMKIQLIPGRYGDIEDVIHAFDLMQCKVAFDGEKIYTFRESLRCIYRKQIKVSASVSNPIRTLSRIMKYHKHKDYDIEVFEIVKLCSNNKYKLDIDSTILDLGFYL